MQERSSIWGPAASPPRQLWKLWSTTGEHKTRHTRKSCSRANGTLCWPAQSGLRTASWKDWRRAVIWTRRTLPELPWMSGHHPRRAGTNACTRVRADLREPEPAARLPDNTEVASRHAQFDAQRHCDIPSQPSQIHTGDTKTPTSLTWPHACLIRRPQTSGHLRIPV